MSEGSQSSSAGARTGRLEPGTVFAHGYRVVHLLREGGMGAVYVVEELATGQRRALKVMLPEVLGNAKLRERFAREAQVGVQLASPHVVKTVAAGFDEATGMPWIVMELLQGRDLLALVQEQGPLAPAALLPLLQQTCEALGEAHRASVVHRDLKPDNVFVCVGDDGSQRAKVLDFGIAKVLQEALGANSQAIGSPRWMAPEQAQEHSAISPATDVWPLGLVAFYALTGRYYWTASNAPRETLARLMREMLFEPLVPASVRAAELRVGDKLPPGFDAWFARCVAREPSERFANAELAAAGLEAALLGASPSASAPAHTGVGAGVGAGLASAPPAGPARDASGERAFASTMVDPVVAPPAPVVAVAPPSPRTSVDPSAGEWSYDAASATHEGAPRGRGGLYLGVALAVLGLGAVAALLLR